MVDFVAIRADLTTAVAALVAAREALADRHDNAATYAKVDLQATERNVRRGLELIDHTEKVLSGEIE